MLNKDCSDQASKTVIVLGVPRGGTSMVTGVLARLGIYMGPEYKLAPFYENRQLDSCVKERNRSKAKKIIAGYNAAHSVWGVKVLPRGWWFFNGRGMFREPVYIVVFRDIFAIAKRREVSLNRPLVRELFAANWYYFWLLLFLAFTKRPALVLSYEKALLFPDGVAEGICAFLGIDNPMLRQAAADFIKPSPKEYVMRSTTKCQLDKESNHFGYLDIVQPDKIAGWALSVTDNYPLKIELTINGQLKREVEANFLRDDVNKSNARFRKNCGFIINLDAHEILMPGDKVEVTIAGRNVHLINSPYVV